jgi:hypothetical protein
MPWLFQRPAEVTRNIVWVVSLAGLEPITRLSAQPIQLRARRNQETKEPCWASPGGGWTNTEELGSDHLKSGCTVADE